LAVQLRVICPDGQGARTSEGEGIAEVVGKVDSAAPAWSDGVLLANYDHGFLCQWPTKSSLACATEAEDVVM